MVLLKDSAALAGLLIAFMGIYFSVRPELHVLDGVGNGVRSIARTAILLE